MLITCVVSLADDSCELTAALLLSSASSYAFKLESHSPLHTFNTLSVPSGVFVHVF